MNADDEKKLREICEVHGGTNRSIMRTVCEAHALGRARGMTEAAGICEEKFGGWFKHETAPMCAAAIIARRGA